MSFYSLQNYTTYSILSGVMEPEVWVKRAKEIGYSSLGVCEKNNLASHIEFQKECKKNDIKPILGAEFNTTLDSQVKDSDKGADIRGSTLFYAKTQKGLENLISLNNYACKREGGFYYRPRICFESVKEFKDDLICVIPTVDGYSLKKDKLYEFYKLFKDDFYLGINPLLNEDSSFNKVNKEFASLPWNKVFTFNCHYPEEENHHLYKIVRRLDNSSTGQNKNLSRFVENGFLPSLEELESYWKENHSYLSEEVFNECLESLEVIEGQCDVEHPLGTYFMPEVDLETQTIEGDVKEFILQGFKENLCPDCDLESLEDFNQLREWKDCLPHEHISKGETLEENNLKTLDEYIDRIEYEYGIIEDMGFLDYFLVIRDLVKFADRENIERGPARGSAAGALISYLLDITKVDPLRHGLLFERFLNPDRQDLPDIDLDFEIERREEIKEYVEEKYGKEKVCSIGTFARLKVISAIKKVSAANAYGVPDNEGNIVSYNFQKLNSITANKHTTQTSRGEDELKELLDYPDFKKFYKKHRRWFDTVIMPLQETITHMGIHAAGVVVTKDELNKCIPCFEHGETRKPVSQFKDRHCEERGFPKLDILGVRNLDKIAYAKRLIKERHGVEVPDVKEIPLNDEQALKIFKDVKTEGVFQFLTWSQKNFLKILKPNIFEELTHGVAIIRPGPQAAGVDKDYVDTKNGDKQPTYEHEDLEPILKETLGFMIFQESMMEIVKQVGGLTGAQADHVRKACGKKLPEKMAKWESTFKEGGVENGHSKDLLNNLWEKIVAFAEYSFNKSHSVSYTLISYYQAYIKARWPVEYWSAVMQFAKEDDRSEENIMDYKHIVKRDGYGFIFPNIYGFSHRFEPDEKGEHIYWPLDRIHGIGPTSAAALIEDGRHSFESIEDMMEKCNARIVNKRIYEALIKAGFFNPLGKPWEVTKEYFKLRDEIQDYQNDIPYELDHKDMYKWTKLRNEAFKMIVEPWKEVAPFSKGCKAYPDESLNDVKDGTIVHVGGYVQELRNRKTKYKDDFATITLVDDGEEIRIQAWSEFWANEQLDIQGKRPRKGDLVEIIGEKDSFSFDDGKRTYHQVTLSSADPDLIKIVDFSEEDK